MLKFDTVRDIIRCLEIDCKSCSARFICNETAPFDLDTANYMINQLAKSHLEAFKIIEDLKKQAENSFHDDLFLNPTLNKMIISKERIFKYGLFSKSQKKRL